DVRPGRDRNCVADRYALKCEEIEIDLLGGKPNRRRDGDCIASAENPWIAGGVAAGCAAAGQVLRAALDNRRIDAAAGVDDLRIRRECGLGDQVGSYAAVEQAVLCRHRVAILEG